jgi:hypothetical protein
MNAQQAWQVIQDAWFFNLAGDLPPLPQFIQRFCAAYYAGRMADVEQNEGMTVYPFPIWAIRCAFGEYDEC